MQFITERMRPGHKDYDDSYIELVRSIDDKVRDYYFFMSLDKNHVLDDIIDSIETLQINFWEDNIVDIANTGKSKYSGIKLIKNLYNIEDNDIYAFGDGHNDIEMISKVRHGIVMGNSPHALQSVADYIAPRIEEDGFFIACQKFRLI